MKVFIIKEGKEAGQGVAYLDDGTMVVVDQARKALGRTIEVSVTSVLQTTAGKMIFCRWPEAGAAPPAEEPRQSLRLGDRRELRNGRDPRVTDRREGDRRDTPREAHGLAPIPPSTPVPVGPLSSATGEAAALPPPEPAAGDGGVGPDPTPKGD